MYSVQTQGNWPTVGEVLAERMKKSDSIIFPLSYEESINYWHGEIRHEQDGRTSPLPPLGRWLFDEAPNYPFQVPATLHSACAEKRGRFRSE
jgi:hypothetical protein